MAILWFRQFLCHGPPPPPHVTKSDPVTPYVTFSQIGSYIVYTYGRWAGCHRPPPPTEGLQRPYGQYTVYTHMGGGLGVTNVSKICNLFCSNAATIDKGGGLRTAVALALLLVFMFRPLFFPKGYFCPNNTEFATQYPCNNGTFNNVTNGQSDDVCQLCTPGFYCPHQVRLSCVL